VTFSEHDSLFLVAVLAVVAALLIAAQASRIPYPILLVVGGLGLSLVPGMPAVELAPDLVLIAVLPPLLYGGAFFTSLRDLRANAGTISLLAVGLVLTTMLMVAAAATPFRNGRSSSFSPSASSSRHSSSKGSLPGVMKVLRLEDEGLAEKEETKARIYAAEAALARLEELADEGSVRPDTLERLRGLFGFRRDRFRSRFDPESDGSAEDRSLAFQRLMRELLAAERSALVDLRRTGRIDDNVMRRVIRDLDLEEARLDG
jgi:hypothetical protein